MAMNNQLEPLGTEVHILEGEARGAAAGTAPSLTHPKTIQP